MKKFGEPFEGMLQLGVHCEHCHNTVPLADVVDEKIPIRYPYASFRDIIDEVNLTDKEINAFLRGGVNMQTLHVPLVNDRILLEAAAIRKGTGKLYVLLYDMYRKEKVAVKEMEVSVE